MVTVSTSFPVEKRNLKSGSLVCWMLHCIHIGILSSDAPNSAGEVRVYMLCDDDVFAEGEVRWISLNVLLPFYGSITLSSK